MAPARKPHWSQALIEDLKDPAKHVISTSLAIVMRDKFPKARHHFLILPRANIASIYHVTAEHRELLADIALLATNCIELSGRPADDFQLGYHAKPSMQRLHLHCISRDFDSPSMRTSKHWNSFTTELFMPMAEVHRQCIELGRVQRPPSAELYKQLSERKLRCHRCDYYPANMGDLKAHIVKPHDS